ncbi:MAG TPA: hypothetical protein VM370_03115 [Candidatus Thermoplasmatota archaeon]|nr:hypothetical protein [Candidatus Thermoplasmatota archaeon]
MSAAKTEPFPHEKRVLRYAYGAAVVAAALGVVQVSKGDGRILGAHVPAIALLALLAVGAVAALVAVARRSSVLALAGVGAMVLAVIPGGVGSPGLLTYAIGVLFGVALLLVSELVHMTERYERAHRAVEKENVPEEHINRVTDEALKTLASRAAIAALAVAAAIGAAFALAAIGPAQLRAAVETTAPLGVAVAALALAGAASLFILARGAKLRGEATPKELLPDVAE